MTAILFVAGSVSRGMCGYGDEGGRAAQCCTIADLAAVHAQTILSSFRPCRHMRDEALLIDRRLLAGTV